MILGTVQHNKINDFLRQLSVKYDHSAIQSLVNSVTITIEKNDPLSNRELALEVTKSIVDSNLIGLTNPQIEEMNDFWEEAVIDIKTGGMVQNYKAQDLVSALKRAQEAK